VNMRTVSFARAMHDEATKSWSVFVHAMMRECK